MIADLWPVCACGGASPQMLEHSKPICTKIPFFLDTVADEGRAVDDREWAELADADGLRRSRGYRGPALTRAIADELVAAIRISRPS